MSHVNTQLEFPYDVIYLDKLENFKQKVSINWYLRREERIDKDKQEQLGLSFWSKIEKVTYQWKIMKTNSKIISGKSCISQLYIIKKTRSQQCTFWKLSRNRIFRQEKLGRNFHLSRKTTSELFIFLNLIKDC